MFTCLVRLLGFGWLRLFWLSRGEGGVAKGPHGRFAGQVQQSVW